MFQFPCIDGEYYSIEMVSKDGLLLLCMNGGYWNIFSELSKESRGIKYPLLWEKGRKWRRCRYLSGTNIFLCQWKYFTEDYSRKVFHLNSVRVFFFALFFIHQNLPEVSWREACRWFDERDQIPVPDNVCRRRTEEVKRDDTSGAFITRHYPWQRVMALRCAKKRTTIIFRAS